MTLKEFYQGIIDTQVEEHLAAGHDLTSFRVDMDKAIQECNLVGAEAFLNRIRPPRAPALPELDRRKIVSCRGCSARITFVITKAGKHMPIDVDPVSIVALEDDELHVRAVVKGYVPHYSTCPNADEFRTKATK